MQVEIWSDVICPWCYIGKRRFEQALAGFEHNAQVEVVWRSFELDPASERQPTETLVEMLAHKYRVSLKEAAEMNVRVTAVAKQVGLDYQLGEARPGNTFDAHRLLHLAASRQMGDRAAERIMHAYFAESLPVGDRASLARLAPEFGIPEHDALAVLEGDTYSKEVRADEARAERFGITAVPCFIFDESTAVSGAQTVAVFSAALQEAWAAP